MSSIYESIKSLFVSKPTPLPTMSVYDVRVECFQKLSEIQKNLKSADEEYLTVSAIEGKGHENAWKRMECFTKEYKKEYELCEKVMKY
jgi:hypothetical protein